MALKRFLTLRRLPSGPRVARPEYRLRGCLEEPATAKATRRPRADRAEPHARRADHGTVYRSGIRRTQTRPTDKFVCNRVADY